ncbi:MAG: hypothetical protein LJF06_07095 [Gemmatimonadetes bacterium]|nr:hypothetical protein [Gemmatimonadota bacterium]
MPTQRAGAPAPDASERRGASVVEALVSLLLGLFLTSLALTVVARQRAAVAALDRTSDALAAVRVARQLLGEEGRDGDARRDGWALSADSLGLRAFRGVGYVCGPGTTPLDLEVEVEGVRLPEPAKDSILILGSGGEWTVAALDGATAATPCFGDTGRVAETWHLSGIPPTGAVFARYFERGSYHVVDEALRYRRGMSGRQPLTPEVVRTPSSVFERSGAFVTLFLEVEGSAAPWHISVAAGGEAPRG